MAELVEATGVQRQSLYNAFQDKQGLFVAVLNRYEQLLKESLTPLLRDDAELPELRQYMEGVLQLQADRDVGGCLLVQTSFGVGVSDPRVRSVVEAGASAIRACFADLIRRSVASGRLSREVVPEACADYLFAVLNGLSALARTGAKKDHVSGVLAHTFATLGVAQSKTPMGGG
ncbi:Transcriptional regulator, TetR family [Labilithrix luteola]|uniref:Transcriptional regulator, TetR family n=2 Tax=Labilithrix luteola TaxID=1391654 RepID=A0A0K1PQ69_9BACT|nr:Transcriptional regulator, TetR family [Labilithrix luteola]